MAATAAIAPDTWTRFKNSLYLQWPSIGTSSVAIAFYSWAIHTLAGIDAEQANWKDILISNVIPILVELGLGVIFMCLAGFLLMTTVDTITVAKVLTIGLMTIAITLSTLSIAINNYQNPDYDNAEVFSGITTPIITYTLIGSLFLIVPTCMIFVTYPNDMPVLFFSIFVSSLAILLSVMSTGITRISR
jgi:hypothetical protein